jgi:PAT family beta-lactamase induction signal transducer AmpG
VARYRRDPSAGTYFAHESFAGWLQRAAAGILVSISPAITVQQLGWAQTEFANWIAVTGIIASVVGIVFGGMADCAGLVKVLFIFILLRMVGFVVFAYTEEYWPNDEYFKGMVLAEGIMSQFVTITVIVLFTRLCLPQVAATQFAVYMALANLTRSIGSGVVVATRRFDGLFPNVFGDGWTPRGLFVVIAAVKF